jgi:hypothetical protein
MCSRVGGSAELTYEEKLRKITTYQKKKIKKYILLIALFGII